MSLEATSWALDVPVGGNAKVILLGLANHAHPDGSESYPALDTLARYANCGRSTARRNVRQLADAGWIEQDGKGPKGQIKYRLLLDRDPRARGPKMTPPDENGGVSLATPGGVTGDRQGVSPMTPEPPKNRPRTSSGVAGASIEASPVTDDVRRALAAAGFDRLTIEQFDGAIGLALGEVDAPADVDWHRVGTAIRRARESGKLQATRPDSAIRFVANGFNGFPRLAAPGVPRGAKVDLLDVADAMDAAGPAPGDWVDGEATELDGTGA